MARTGGEEAMTALKSIALAVSIGALLFLALCHGLKVIQP
jgi:hypothetical protein